MSIIPKERALPIIENAFTQQTLVDQLCKLMDSDGGDFHVDLAGMVKGVFDFDYSELGYEEYNLFHYAFLDLLTIESLLPKDKAKLYYDKIQDLVSKQSFTLNQ